MSEIGCLFYRIYLDKRGPSNASGRKMLHKAECLSRNLFGDMARRLKELRNIQPGDIGFLLNLDRDELIGLFKALSEAQLNIVADAWSGRFAAQIRVEPIGEICRVKDAAYMLQKAGVCMRQSKSGLPVPQYPVQERDICKKILADFEEHIMPDESDK